MQWCLSHFEVPTRDECAYPKFRYRPCRVSHLLLPELASSLTRLSRCSYYCWLLPEKAEAEHVWCVSKAPLTPEGLATCTLDERYLIQ